MYHATQGIRPSVRNTLYLDIPGFTSNLHVRFPDCRLPVCGRCKKNYKTRDMCRTQGEHTDLPWSTVFICITLDHTCTDANNKLKKGPFTTRNMEWMPYCFKNEVSAETLICAACKTKNYTRKQCRVKSRHKFLPWSTVYVMLSHDNREDSSRHGDGKDDNDSVSQSESASRKRSIDGSSSEHRSKRRATGDKGEEEVKLESSDRDPSSDAEDGPQSKKDSKGDDITKVDRSRTFLLEVAVDTCIIKWLDYDRSKAIPGHPFLNDPSGTIHALTAHRGLMSHPQMYSNPAGYFHPGVDTTSASQLFSMDNIPRPFPSPLYMHHSAYPSWAGSNALSLSQKSSSGRDSGGDEQSEYRPHPYWSRENYENQLQSQANIRGWPTGYQVPYDSSQLAQQNMAVAQVRSSGMYPNPYSDQEAENGQYNAASHQHQFHHQY